MAQSKRWCLTLNNFTPEEHQSLQQYFRSDKVLYAIIGQEVGESGTPHLQMFCCSKNNVRLAALKKINPRMHAEVAHGSTQQASDYCEKDGVFEKFGEMPPSPAERAAMGSKKSEEIYKQVLDLARKGQFVKIQDEFTSYWFRYRQTILCAPRDSGYRIASMPFVTGIWIWGPAGTGKSRLARELFPNAYQKRINKWWDGYNCETAVLIEDMDLTHTFISHDLKLWCDRYTFPAEIKGGAITARPHHVVITSQYAIQDIWTDKETRAALLRRCDIAYLGSSSDYKYVENKLRQVVARRVVPCIDASDAPSAAADPPIAVAAQPVTEFLSDLSASTEPVSVLLATEEPVPTTSHGN